MPSPERAFHEAKLGTVPIRDLGLTIAGTGLEPILAEFRSELHAAGIRRLQPEFYLSTEWGVPFGTVAIAIPFYLARADLTALHVERLGYVEGATRSDILRYLRHEMGHVANYAYRLYENENWIKHFGSITQPYEEEYHPEPFHRSYVQHLPGWYAQKHPDEDWAETFAVWMTPGLDWRSAYAGSPALAKLLYCDQTMRALREREPLVAVAELDEDVGQLASSLEQFYGNQTAPADVLPPGLDGSLRTIFEELASRTGQQPAAELIRRLEQELMANVFRWTGHFPERTRLLVQQLAQRAAELQLGFPADQEVPTIVALTALVTALAMNHVRRGTYLP